MPMTPGGRLLHFPSSWIAIGGLAALPFAFLLRFTSALRRSLWIDEFHSLYHATRDTLPDLVGGLARDNHPPFSFLVTRLMVSGFGDSELVLRLPSVLFGLLACALTWRLAHRCRNPQAVLFAPWLVAGSFLHVFASAEVRMYGMMSFFVIALVWGVDAFRRDGARWPAGLATAAACTLGLLTHYYFAVYLFSVVAAALWIAGMERENRRRMFRFTAAVLVGVVLASPWYLLVLPGQLAHGLPPGAARSPLASLVPVYGHLLFHQVSLAPGILQPVFKLGALLGLCLAAVGAGWALWGPCRREGRGVSIPAVAAGLGVPALVAGLATIHGRVGYGWNYFVPSIPALALLFGFLPRRRLFSLAAICVVGLVSGLGLLHAWSKGGSEDIRGAVRWIAAHAAATDLVVAVEMNPPVFPNALGWQYYGPREAPELKRIPLDPRSGEPLAGGAVHQANRAWVMQRGAGRDHPALTWMRRRFQGEEVRSFGYSISVHRFSGPRSSTR